MADPTPDEVAAAIATLQAFEHARESHVDVAAPAEPVKPSEVILPPPSAPAVVAPTLEALLADTGTATGFKSLGPPYRDYAADSVKASPNGF